LCAGIGTVRAATCNLTTNTLAALKSAINCAGSGGTVTVPNNLAHTTINVTSEAAVWNYYAIHISQPVTIEGNNIILDAQNANRGIMYIQANVTIRNVTFTNTNITTNISGWSPAVLVAADILNISTCTSKPTITFENCRFVNCASDYAGGALGVANAIVTLRKCIFWNNSAGMVSNGGGSIYMNRCADVTLTDNFFRHGSAGCILWKAGGTIRGSGNVFNDQPNLTPAAYPITASTIGVAFTSSTGSAWQIGSPTASNVIAFVGHDMLRVVGAGATMYDAASGRWNNQTSFVDKLIVGEGITVIDRGLLWGNQIRNSIELTSTLTTIKSLAFHEPYNSALTITVKATTPPTIENIDAFSGTSTSGSAYAAGFTLNVPAGRECYYADDDKWRQFEHGAAQGSKYFGGTIAHSSNPRFYIDCAKKLWITGSGAVPSMYRSGSDMRPWGTNGTSAMGILQVDVASGITELGQDAMAYLPDVTKITLQSLNTKLGTSFGSVCLKLSELEIKGSGSRVPAAISDAYSFFQGITKSAVKLIIPDDMVGLYGTGTTTGGSTSSQNPTIVWNEFNIPQLVITFDANGGEW
jgi:hypothetical protein